MSAVPRVTSFLSRRGLLLQSSSKHLYFMTLCEHYANRGYPHTYAPYFPSGDSTYMAAI
jgi:hypothetical protein